MLMAGPLTAQAATPPGFLPPPHDEKAARAFATFLAAQKAPSLDWSGPLPEQTAGTISNAWRAAVLARIDAYRAFAGLPPLHSARTDWNDACQEAALMLQARDLALHFATPGWDHYTPAGALALRHSSIALGITGLAALDAFVRDDGPQHAGVPHRRWLFFPPLRQTGIGALPHRSFRQREAFVLWMVEPPADAAKDAFAYLKRWRFPDAASRAHPQAVAWPPPGAFPREHLPRRWSLSFHGADFSAADVAVTRERTGEPISLVVEPKDLPAADPTLVWIIESTAFPDFGDRRAADLKLRVHVSGIAGEGLPAELAWEVVLWRE